MGYYHGNRLLRTSAGGRRGRAARPNLVGGGGERGEGAKSDRQNS